VDQAARIRFSADFWRDAVRGKNRCGTGGNVVGVLDEDRATRSQVVDDDLVVDDLVADVHRPLVAGQALVER
jgi:hypothetical protein